MSKTCDFLGLSKENGNLLGWVFWLVGLVFFFTDWLFVAV